jgi:hypothetical protein
MRTYTFWDEPAHGYLEVTEDELVELGLYKDDFPHSPAEYRAGSITSTWKRTKTHQGSAKPISGHMDTNRKSTGASSLRLRASVISVGEK